jgi:O-antigen/teichoic acid export membrane protein
LEIKSLPRLKHGILANFAGSSWSAGAQLVCIPLYIKFMGIEAYGLIGFYLMFQAITQVLDLGLSPTMNREMARYSVQPEKAAEARDLVRTLEIGYWLTGFVIGAALVVGSAWFAAHWIKATALPAHSIRQALVLMGALAFFQWPVTFYQGGLLGLHRQVLYNAVRIIVATLNSVGGVLVLWLVSPTIQALLVWQVGVSAVQAIVLAMLLWKCLPSAPRTPRFEASLLRSIGAFAAGVGGITLMGLILSQIDKVFVSKLLPLKLFGYYSLAWSLAGGLALISAIIFNVIFPRMSAQIAAGDEDGLRRSYHAGSQLMAVLILPIAAVFVFFPFQVMHLWTRNTETATFAAPILALLSIGSALNALLFLPYSLQLAFGWTKLSLMAGLISIALVIPVIILATKRFGPLGAAATWAILNLLNILIVVPVMHRRLLRSEKWEYLKDIGLPIMATLAMATLARLAFPNVTSLRATVAILSGTWVCAFVFAVLCAPQISPWFFARILNMRPVTVKRAGSPS